MKFLLAFLISFSLLEATTSRAVFEKYKNRHFVETGSYIGDGIQMALDAGFKNIYSIEVGPHLYQRCKARFASNANVHLFLGDSTHLLSAAIREIQEPITFWLDGHYSWGDTAKADKNTPILEELKAIKQHPIKTHTILIDDVRDFGKTQFDFIRLEQIIDAILEINPAYEILFEDGLIQNDVLVAYIPE